MNGRVRNAWVGMAAVVVLALSAAAALAGAFAPAVAAAPDAAQLNAFLAQHGSPMTGTGATFIAAGRAYGVSPLFLVAIAGAETNFGAFLYAENGDQSAYNAFNWFYGPTRITSDCSSWDDAITRVAQGLSGPIYYGAGLYSVDAIAPTYCPDGTEEWIANVKAFMSELGGDPSDTRIAATGIQPAPSTTPPAASPGLVALSGAIKLDDGDREVGQRIYAWFTLTNTGGQPIELQGIRLAVRGPGGTVRDLVSDEPAALPAGQSLEVSSSWLLDLAGRWRGWIEVTQGGTVSLVGAKQAFSFRVRLPKALELHRWQLRHSALTDSI